MTCGLVLLVAALPLSEGIRQRYSIVWIIMLSVMVSSTGGQLDDIIVAVDTTGHIEAVVDIARQQDEQIKRQVEAAARCRVRCLSNRQEYSNSRLPRKSALDRCLKDNICSSCLKPCSQPFVNLVFCRHSCQDAVGEDCEDTCQFLQTIYSARPGQCPSLEQLTSYGALCVQACLADSDCPDNSHKCCHNGCGQVCAPPSTSYIGFPAIPDQPQLLELKDEGAIVLKWNSVVSNSSGPVLYIVWARWNVGRHHSVQHMTNWEEIAQTSDTVVRINDISPGHWYQYRVSAININGTQGASQPTQPFCLPREPSAPGVPVNLTEGDTLVQGNHVTLSVQWKPPLQSDLPVTRYKIFWMKTLGSIPSDHDSREYREVIPGDQLQFDVPDLDPASTYLVQVQAICQYGDARLKSEKAVIYIYTYPLSKAAQVAITTSTIAVDVETLPTPLAPSDVRIETPFFQNGLLRANVSWTISQETIWTGKSLLQWTPQACIADAATDNTLPKLLTATTWDKYFVIYELRFDCRYVVQVRLVSEQGVMGRESRMSFVTPSCGEVLVSGSIRPECPSSVPRIPEEPANLQYRFLISGGNISAQLTWDPPLSDSPVTAYRITWGQTIADDSNVWDKNTVLTKVLAKDARGFQLDQLCEGNAYVTRIQALSRIGSGKVAVLFFKAPVLTNINQLEPPDTDNPGYGILEESTGWRPGGDQVVTARPHSDNHTLHPSSCPRPPRPLYLNVLTLCLILLHKAYCDSVPCQPVLSQSP